MGPGAIPCNGLVGSFDRWTGALHTSPQVQKSASLTAIATPTALFAKTNRISPLWRKGRNDMRFQLSSRAYLQGYTVPSGLHTSINEPG